MLLGEGDEGLDFENDLGMTASRQAEVRAALFAMLGDSSGGSAVQASRSPRQERVVDVSGSVEITGPGQSTQSGGSTEEWSCVACTLYNPSTRLDCSACGTYHMSE
jgi:hypothetical protein